MATCNISELRSYNSCPLLLEQNRLYNKAVQVSTSHLDEELQKIFNTVLYYNLRGHQKNITPKRVVQLWKEAIDKIGADINDDDLKRGAYCISVFVDYYVNRFHEEIIGIEVPFSLPLTHNVILQDKFPFLSKNKFGTRILILNTQPGLKDHPKVDIFNSLYALGYRNEFQKKELCITVHDLVRNNMCEVYKDDKDIQVAKSKVALLADLYYNKYNVPNESFCNFCLIGKECLNNRLK